MPWDLSSAEDGAKGPFGASAASELCGGLWLPCVIPCVGTAKPPTARDSRGWKGKCSIYLSKCLWLCSWDQNHTMSLALKAVLNVRSPAQEWQGCAKPGGIFPENFNQIHLYLFLNISLNDMVIDWIFLLKIITKKVIFFVVPAFFWPKVECSAENFRSHNTWDFQGGTFPFYLLINIFLKKFEILSFPYWNEKSFQTFRWFPHESSRTVWSCFFLKKTYSFRHPQQEAKWYFLPSCILGEGSPQ